MSDTGREGVTLKACPFCGEESPKAHYIRDGQSLSCRKCGASVRAFNPNAGDKCIELWNTRASGWQPIESAPKDGPVLLYFGNRIWRDIHGNTVSFGEARDDVERTEPALCKDGDILESGTAHSVWEEWRGQENIPTHWMPLPPTPQGEG